MKLMIRNLTPVVLICLGALWHGPGHAGAIYVSVVGASGGQAIMGHAFLIVAEQPGQLLTAKYYQYALNLPTDLKFNASTVIQLNSFPFIVDSGPAWLFIKRYTQEDRVVLIYQLRMTDAQIRRLVSTLESDRLSRQRSPHYDYSFDSSNCVTKIFDLINSVVDEKDKFLYRSPRSVLTTFDVLHAERSALVVPLAAAPRLNRSPLVIARMTFRQKSLVEVQTAVTAFESLSTLFDLCRTSVGARDILVRMYGNPAVRHSARYLNVFRALLASCSAGTTATRATYNRHLDFLRFDTYDQTFLDLSEKYFL